MFNIQGIKRAAKSQWIDNYNTILLSVLDQRSPFQP